MKVLLVPEGMGGKKMDEVLLVSTTSPLGRALVGKTSGERFVFMEREMVVGVVG